MLARRKLLLGSVAALLSPSLADAQIVQFSGASTTVGWQPLKLGAGGFISRIDMTSDGTKVIGNDTYGAHIWNASAANPGNAGGTGVWQPLVTGTRMPSSIVAPWLPANTGACYEIRIAPSNTSHLYMYINGLIYSSTNQGLKWTQTGFTQSSTSGADQTTESGGRYMAVDPANENIVVAGTAGGSCYYTINGGGTWTAIAGLATPGTPGGAGQKGGYLIVFDPSSAVTGGATQGVYIASYGTGLYSSTTGVSGSFTAVASTPTTCVHLVIDTAGVVYLVDNSSGGMLGKVNKLSSGSWSTVTTGLSSNRSVAIDPSSNTHLVAVNGVGQISNFNGTAWSSAQGPLRVANDIPWLAATTDGSTLDMDDIMFDPSQSNVLYGCTGVGTFTTSPTSVGSPAHATWTSIAAGIEQLVTNRGRSPPGGNFQVICWDRPVFTIENINKFPTSYGVVTALTSLREGYALDYASNNSQFSLVVAQNGASDSSGFTINNGGTDGGPTNWTTPITGFTQITDLLSNGGGRVGANVACASSTNWVLVVQDDTAGGAVAASGLWYTTNGGTNWTSPAITGISGSNSGWNNEFFLLSRQILVADRQTIGTFYAYNYGSSTGTAGVYISTNSGATWTNAHSGAFDPVNSSQFQAKLDVMPSTAGYLFYTSGQQAPDSTSQAFYTSTDGGAATWTSVSNVTDVMSFGFGAPTTSAFSTLFIYGRVGGVLGVWYSPDNAVTWVQIEGQWPNDSLDQVLWVSGDNNVKYRCYVGFAGSGAAYYST